MNNWWRECRNFALYIGLDDSRDVLKTIPEWKGEDVGFEPHIWCYSNDDYIKVLNQLGVDTTGITIR